MADLVASIPAEFEVSDTGAAVYRIPIEVPTGQGGLRPNLAVVYDSQGGTGTLGQQFGIAGLSTIRRCQQTIVQDGQRRSVRYDADDKFCIDGQRLVLIAGTYGADGSEYRTEIESFRKITAHSTTGNGPTSFTVREPTGLAHTYFPAGGQTKNGYHGLWARSLTFDTFGNRLEYRYVDSGPSGEFLIDRVEYSTNFSQGVNSPRYAIQFVWDDRPVADVRTGYEAGVVRVQQRILEEIFVQRLDEFEQLDDDIRTYKFFYQTGSNGRIQLASASQCPTLSSCVPATTFEWDEGSQGWGAAASSGQSSNGYSDRRVGDFDGDGLEDLFVVKNSEWHVFPASNGNLGAAIDTNKAATNAQYTLPFDFNGDGKTDLLVPGSDSKWHVYQSTGNGFTDINTGVASTGYQYSYAQDVDGDRLDDLLYMSGTSIYLRKSTGSGFEATATVVYSSTELGYFAVQPKASANRQVDFDGDGMGDIFVYLWDYECEPEEGCTSWENWDAKRFDGTSYVNYGNVSLTNIGPVPVDLNNDGLTDVAWGGGSWWYHKISDGATFSNFTLSTVTSTSYVDAVFSDYDGDGRMDFIGKTSTNRVVHKFNGIGFDTTGIPIGGPLDIHSQSITGNGYGELVGTQSGSWHVRASNARPAFIDKITDGFGNTVEPTYASVLVMSEHYETGSNPTFPVQRVTSPLYVVDEYTASDGIGGSYTMNYKYWDAKVHVQGRGNLGFNRIRAVDGRDGTYRDTYFYQYWPYIGLSGVTVVRQSEATGTNIQRTLPTMGFSYLGFGESQRVFRRVEQIETTDFEVGGALNGQQIRKVFRDPVYNSSYGTVASETITTTSDQAPGESFVTTIEYQYDNFTTPWCLGLPKQTKVTRSAIGSVTKTRTIDRTFDSTDCRMRTSTDVSESSTALQLKTTLTYDGFGNVETLTHNNSVGTADERKTEYLYDEWGLSLETQTSYVDGAPNSTIGMTWNHSFNVPLTFENAQGQSTTWQYDDLGRIKKEIRPDGTDTTFTFADCVDCWSTGRGRFYINRLDSDGQQLRDYRDRLGRSIGGYQFLPTGTKSEHTIIFDNRGLVDKFYLPSVNGEPSYFVDYDYDLIGRVTQEDRPIDEATTSGAVTTFAYQGLTQTVTNAESQATTTEVDSLGRVVKVTDALNGELEYEYTVFDELHKSWDAADELTTIDYNDRGDRISSDSPDMGLWSYTYTVFGELKTQTDAKAQTTTFAYNQLGLPTSRIEPEGTTLWAYYDTIGHKLWLTSSVASPGGFSESYDYDTLSRRKSLSTTIDGATYTTDYSYHPAGNGKGKLDRITYPVSTSGFRLKVDYEYDAFGYLEKVTNGDTPSTIYYQLNELDSLGRERLIALGNGLDVDRVYDRANGYLKEIKSGPNLSATIQNLSYDDWDKVGNLIERSDNNQSVSERFTYDSLNRVKTAARNTIQTLSVNYSATGNIDYKSDVGTYTYGVGNAGPSAVTSITGIRAGTYGYDANGNMTSRAGDTITWYSYNKPDRIDYGSDFAEFEYGPDRRRVKQTAQDGGTTTTTIYVSGVFEKETSGSLSKYRHNISANGNTIAVYTRPTSGAATTRYVHRDHLGSVVALTDAAGAIVEEHSFDAFGKRRNTDWTADLTDSRFNDSHLTERGFTGHEALDSVRLTHMNGRVQDPIIGRMISADPFVPGAFNSQAHNRYSYVFNQPTSLVDPSGYGPCIRFLWIIRWNCGGDGYGGKPPEELRHCYQSLCVTGPESFDDLPISFGQPSWQRYFDVFERDLEFLDQHEHSVDQNLSGRGIGVLFRQFATDFESRFLSVQSDNTFFGFGDEGKFDGITPKQFDVAIDNLRSNLLDAINFSLRVRSRRDYTKGGAFLNNKRSFPVFGSRRLSREIDPGNDALITRYIERELADSSYTIGAVVITAESLDGLVESMQQHSRELQAPVFVSTSMVDRLAGGIERVRILETFRITGGAGGEGTCVNTVTGQNCF